MTIATDTPKRRVIVWGPGEIGSALIRYFLDSDDFELVGVRAYSPRKNGLDAGVMVGRSPANVTVSTSRDEVLKIDADLVVLTPLPKAIMEGMDADVATILRSGTSVITTAGYFAPSMRTWASADRSPLDILTTLAETKGPVLEQAGLPSALQAPVLALLRGVVTILQRFGPTQRVGNRIFESVLQRKGMRRLSGEALLAACQAGGSSLHGAGLHPGFAAEQLSLTIASLADRIDHIRMAESGDVAQGREGMWGGPAVMGFGMDPAEVDDRHTFARGCDLYMRDVAANIAYALYGTHTRDVEVKTTLRGIPAVTGVNALGEWIAPGTTGATHAVLAATASGRPFFTDEQRWYVGADNNRYPNDGPFGQPGDAGYELHVDANPVRLKSQTTIDPLGDDPWASVTDISVNMIVHAIDAVCDGDPGVLLPDVRPHYRVNSSPIPSAGFEDKVPSATIVVMGSGAVADAVIAAAERSRSVTVAAVVDTDLASVASSSPDCVVVAPGRSVDEVVALLRASHDVVHAGSFGSDPAAMHAIAAACREGNTSIHEVGGAGTVVAERLIPVNARTVTDVNHIRFVEALDLSTMSSDADLEVFGIGDPNPDASALFKVADARGAQAVLVAAAEALGVDPSALKIEHGARAMGPGGVHLTRRARVGSKVVLTHELCWFSGADHAFYGDDLPFGGFSDPLCFTLDVDGVRGRLRTQIAVEPIDTADADAAITARGVLDALAAVRSAPPGIMTTDPAPRFVRDRRIRLDTPDQNGGRVRSGAER